MSEIKKYRGNVFDFCFLANTLNVNFYQVMYFVYHTNAFTHHSKSPSQENASFTFNKYDKNTLFIRAIIIFPLFFCRSGSCLVLFLVVAAETVLLTSDISSVVSILMLFWRFFFYWIPYKISVFTSINFNVVVINDYLMVLLFHCSFTECLITHSLYTLMFLCVSASQLNLYLNLRCFCEKNTRNGILFMSSEIKCYISFELFYIKCNEKNKWPGFLNRIAKSEPFWTLIWIWMQNCQIST